MDDIVATLDGAIGDTYSAIYSKQVAPNKSVNSFYNMITISRGVKMLRVCCW